MTEHSDKTIADTLDANVWTFAKTMPQNPHYWAPRKSWVGEVSFDNMVMHIRANGYVQRYGRTDYLCLNVGAWKYWTMGAPLPMTRLINRCAIKPNDMEDAIT